MRNIAPQRNGFVHTVTEAYNKHHALRRPSITSYTPSSPSPPSQQPQSHGTLSSGLDGVADRKDNVSKRSSLVLSLCSPSTRECLSSLNGAGAREREPLTLVER